MTHSIFGTFVSKKINKIRWKPSLNNACDMVVAGSWDDDNNTISLWKLVKNEAELDVSTIGICAVEVDGDVAELKFINNEVFAVATTSGSVGLYSLSLEDNQWTIETSRSWDKLHCYSNGEASPCTDLARFGDNIATVGENGSVIMISVEQNVVSKPIEADSCTIRCVSFQSENEFMTGNNHGLIKIWDLRDSAGSAQKCLKLHDSQVGCTRIAHHPTQKHVLLAGNDDGAIVVWDLRNNMHPITVFEGHKSSVNEIQFHQDWPEHVFSCSSSGELWHWNAANTSKSHLNSVYNTSLISDVSLDGREDGCPWLCTDKQKIPVYSLVENMHLPINSLDLCSNNLICACDNEALYFVQNLAI